MYTHIYIYISQKLIYKCIYMYISVLPIRITRLRARRAQPLEVLAQEGASESQRPF